MVSREISIRIRTAIVILAFCMTLTVSALAEERTAPEVMVDGLHLIKGTKKALVYAKPDVDLSQYSRFYLVEPKIAFEKNWLKDQNKTPNQYVRKEDMQRIRVELAGLFTEIFKNELQNDGGYSMADAPADDVLIILPAIVDLDVISPDTPGTRNQRSLMASVGSMMLYMELIDSVTGDKLVKAIDKKYDRTPVRTGIRNAVRNETAARDMLGEWAHLLRLALDEARATVTKPD
jgi:hypothetical protein